MPYAPRPRCRICNRKYASNGKSLCLVCRRRYYGPSYYRMKTALLRAWVAKKGLLCPGYGRPSHPVLRAADLTADHIVPIAQGGRSIPANLAVLCRDCNIRKGSGPALPPPSPSPARL